MEKVHIMHAACPELPLDYLLMQLITQETEQSLAVEKNTQLMSGLIELTSVVEELSLSEQHDSDKTNDETIKFQISNFSAHMA